jgi:hypothetical protein
MKMNHRLTVLLVALAAAVGIALADARIETSTRVTMVGGFGNTEARTKTEFQGQNKYDISNFRLTGLAGVAGQYQNSVVVTRVDSGVIWTLHHADRTYSQQPLTGLVPEDTARLRAYQDSARARRHYQVVRSELTVQHPDSNKTINDFPCTKHVITLTVVLRDSAARDTVTEVMTTTLWLTPLTDKLRQVQAEQKRFYDAYVARTNTRLSPDEAAGYGLSFLTVMLGLSEQEAAANLAKVRAELGKLQGYAVVTDVNWRVRGDSSAQTTAAAPPEPAAPSPLSLSRGGLGDYVGGRIAQQAMQGRTQPSTDLAFSSYSEVTLVSTDPVDPTHFVVPEGYRRVTR